MAKRKSPPSQRCTPPTIEKIRNAIEQEMLAKGMGPGDHYPYEIAIKHAKRAMEGGIPGDLAPMRFQIILESLVKKIAETAYRGESLGQPYVIAIEESSATDTYTDLMSWEKADAVFSDPESKATWEKAKQILGERPDQLAVVIFSSTLHMTKFFFFPRPTRHEIATRSGRAE
jgi:hypothetical protein